jgi:flagellin-like protein
MNLKQAKDLLTGDERAVSPVIGVILMVAITVILAAVIGTFVLGLGDQVSESAPQASFSVDDVDTANNQVTISHTGGDTLKSDDVTIKMENQNGDTLSASASDGTGEKLGTADDLVLDVSVPEFLYAGTEAYGTTYDQSGLTAISDGDTITVTLVDESSGQIIFEQEIDV